MPSREQTDREAEELHDRLRGMTVDELLDEMNRLKAEILMIEVVLGFAPKL